MCQSEGFMRLQQFTRVFLFGKADESVSQTAAQTAVVARRKEAARTSLSALLANNSPQAAKDGIAMLRMLVANLIKQPNVPRYRRIATT